MGPTSPEAQSCKGLASELAMIKGWKKPDEAALAARMKHPSPLQTRFVELQKNKYFDGSCAAAILLNAVLLGAMVDTSAQGQMQPRDLPPAMRASDKVFTVWFFFELMIRMGSGAYWFIFGPNAGWNIFDLIAVALDIIISIADATQEAEGGAFGNLTAVRMLRVVRISRAIRIVRLFEFFAELRMMIFSVLRSGKSLVWSLTMFYVIIYIFAIYFVQSVSFHTVALSDDWNPAVQGSLHNDADYSTLRKHWQSIFWGQYTLYACMTGGYNWADVAAPLIDIHFVHGLMLMFFTFFTIFVVTNIITGIFVDTAIQSAQSDRDQVIEEQIRSRDTELGQMRQIFEDADVDGSGTISESEFEQHLDDARIRAHLRSMGLEVDEARGLFKLLDIDKSGEIGLDEFVFGCLRLKGGAKAIDLATLMYENKRLAVQIAKINQDVEAGFALLERNVGRIGERDAGCNSYVENIRTSRRDTSRIVSPRGARQYQ